MPALSEGALPPADTIAGAFIRNVEGRIAELEATRATAADDARQRSCATCSGSGACCSPARR